MTGSLNIICKKDFRHEFSFFNGSTETLSLTHLTANIHDAWQRFFVDAPLK